jgi:dihydrofolate synthase/folylpolyglutamate synthase
VSDRLLPHDAALERLKALHPKRIDLSLDRMRRLCGALGDPQDRLPPVIHVAGTNGKGSTVAFLRGIAEAAGLRVHVYTSPHLVRFAERIRVAGRLIDERRLAEVLDRVTRANAGAPITFFEVTTAAAFVAFAETPADLCLLEVGLGGRLDATNVIGRAAVSAIAPVDLDHREFLGDSIEQIAAEKAGILRRGAPAVAGRQSGAALEVIEAAAKRAGAPLSAMGRDWDVWGERGGLVWQGGDRLLDLPAPALAGAHQIDNAGLAVACALALGDPRIDEAAIAEGLRSTAWPARYQRIDRGPLGERARAAGAELRLDGGHNPHAATALAETLRTAAARDGRPTVLIAGLLANKDAAAFFDAFRTPGPRVVCVPFAAETAAAPERLAEAARAAGLSAEVADGVEAALDRALAGAGPLPPRVVICGSLYLAGEVLALSPETWPA